MSRIRILLISLSVLVLTTPPKTGHVHVQHPTYRHNRHVKHIEDTDSTV